MKSVLQAWLLPLELLIVLQQVENLIASLLWSVGWFWRQ